MSTEIEQTTIILSTPALILIHNADAGDMTEDEIKAVTSYEVVLHKEGYNYTIGMPEDDQQGDLTQCEALKGLDQECYEVSLTYFKNY